MLWTEQTMYCANSHYLWPFQPFQNEPRMDVPTVYQDGCTRKTPTQDSNPYGRVPQIHTHTPTDILEGE